MTRWFDSCKGCPFGQTATAANCLSCRSFPFCWVMAWLLLYVTYPLRWDNTVARFSSGLEAKATVVQCQVGTLHESQLFLIVSSGRLTVNATVLSIYGTIYLRMCYRKKNMANVCTSSTTINDNSTCTVPWTRFIKKNAECRSCIRNMSYVILRSHPKCHSVQLDSHTVVKTIEKINLFDC